MLGEFRGRKGVAQVKYAYRNGYLLDGTENMQVRSGLAVLTEGKLITGIVPEREIPEGCTAVEIEGGYVMPGWINVHVDLAGKGKRKK